METRPDRIDRYRREAARLRTEAETALDSDIDGRFSTSRGNTSYRPSASRGRLCSDPVDAAPLIGARPAQLQGQFADPDPINPSVN
jgi:hypothetical protein